MNDKTSKFNIILVILLIVNLVLTSAVLTIQIVREFNESHTDSQYTLYIGTNDRYTKCQEIPFDECRTIVENTCLQYISGFTVTEASGVWTDDAGNVVKEQSLVCHISGATEAQVGAIADKLLTELNQSSIMIEHQKIYYTYRNQ